MMNERQPYEKLIADKLQQLRGPDVNTSWDQMKRLLDNDQQPKGGGRKKRPGGWWGIGIVAIVLTTGLLFYVQSNKSSTKNIAAVQNNGDKDNAAAANQTGNDNQKNNTTGETSTLANSSVTTEDNKKETNGTAATTANAGSTQPGDNTNEVAGAKNEIKTGNNNTGSKTSGTIAKNNIKTAVDGNETAGVDKAGNGLAISGKNEVKDKKLAAAKAAGDKYNNHTATVNANDVAAKTKAGKNKDANAKAGNGLVNDNAVGSAAGNNNVLLANNRIINNNKKDKAGKNTLSKLYVVDGSPTTGNRPNGRGRRGNILTGDNRIKNTKDINDNTVSDVAVNDENALTGKRTSGNTQDNNVSGDVTDKKVYADEWGNLVLPYPYESANTSGIVEGNIAGNRSTNNLLSKEAKELALKNKFAEVGKKKRSLNINLADVFMPFSLKRDGEPWWAVGLSLNSSLAVAGQSRYNYNVNAKSNTISDYLPSPYVQYHMNDYVYVQTELNLSTPQHVPQLLVSQFTTQNPVTQGTLQTSIYIQKLYYFNWPFSLHYSPVKNLYVAGGLQFSSLQSGIALREQKELYVSNPGATNSFVYKFKDDSTAARFTPTEWRWETGADYYISRFTLGFRYNKAFKDAIRLNVSSALPQTINRNTSFMLFMKYNLFEGRNKDNAGPRSSLVRY